MWYITIIIIICTCFTFNNGVLKQFTMMSRHGDRTPSESLPLYPNDPNINETYEPYGNLVLTNKGKRRLYNLGGYIRSKYGKFLGPYYDQSLTSFRTYNDSRVVESAQALAAGVFPPVDYQMWLPNMMWQPIPIDISKKLDLIYRYSACENYENAIANLTNDPAFQEELAIYQPFIDYINVHAGYKNDYGDIYGLFSLFYSQWDWGLTLADWVVGIYPEPLYQASVFSLNSKVYTTQMKQLTGGLWLREILRNMDSFIDGNSTLTNIYYFIHELDITAIRSTLDVSDDKIPFYASSLLFELHQDENDDYYVKLIYRHIDVPRILHIPGCRSYMCPLEEFKKLSEPYIADDPEEACGSLIINS